MERNRRLHGRQADELHDVVGHHVAQRSRGVVISTATFDAYSLGHCNLHMIDVVAAPDRLEEAIPETKYQDVLHRFFAKIVVDAIHLPLAENRVDGGVEMFR